MESDKVIVYGENGEHMEDLGFCVWPTCRGKWARVAGYVGDGGGDILHCEDYAKRGGKCEAMGGDCVQRPKATGRLPKARR